MPARWHVPFASRLETGLANDLEKIRIGVQRFEGGPLALMRDFRVAQPIHLLEPLQRGVTFTEGEVNRGHRELAESRATPRLLQPREHGASIGFSDRAQYTPDVPVREHAAAPFASPSRPTQES